MPPQLRQETRGPAAIVIDGAQQALSVARNLGRSGVPVYALTSSSEGVRFSRYARWLPMADGGSPKSWERFLLDPASDFLAGSVLLACTDSAIQLVARNSEQLSRKFLIEEGDREIRLCLLDKFRTYEKAKEARIPIVAYELLESFLQLDSLAERLRFPLIIKPLYSPDSEALGAKFVMVNNRNELSEKGRRLLRLGVPSVAMEFVPGGDDLLCSYYTYMDENSHPLVEFTKRLLRRSPMHTGIGCYHVTDWNPEIAELGRRFFQHVKLKGIGNIEFKRDRRDGQFKVIEANARFTSADAVVTKSGIDLATITYNRLTHRPLPPVRPYRKGLVLWLPAEDIRAFFQLRALGKITFGRWLSSLLRVRQLPYFSWRDPLPSFYVNAVRTVRLARMAKPRIVVSIREFGGGTRR